MEGLPSDRVGMGRVVASLADQGTTSMRIFVKSNRENLVINGDGSLGVVQGGEGWRRVVHSGWRLETNGAEEERGERF